MDLDVFIEEIKSVYQDATEIGFDSIVIAIDTDLDNTYYINDTYEGFQCDLFDYLFDDLYDVSKNWILWLVLFFGMFSERISVTIRRGNCKRRYI